MRKFWAVLKRDLKMSLRRKGGVLYYLGFFLIIITLFPFATKADGVVLHTIAYGVVWVAALLVSTLSLPDIFEEDLEDGSLELMLLMPIVLPVLVAKYLAHWLTTGLPLALLSPLLGILLGLSVEEAWPLMLTLLIGTPLITLIGGMASCLTLGLKRGGVLIALLVLPLYIPVLIFGVAGVNDNTGVIALLSLLLVFIPITFIASFFTLRYALETQ
jgi:heme exporter protein B